MELKKYLNRPIWKTVVVIFILTVVSLALAFVALQYAKLINASTLEAGCHSGACFARDHPLFALTEPIVNDIRTLSRFAAELAIIFLFVQMIYRLFVRVKK